MQFRKNSKAKKLNSPQTIQRLEIIWLEYLVGAHVTWKKMRPRKINCGQKGRNSDNKPPIIDFTADI